MFCEKCGKEMPDDAAICTGCGRAMQPTSTMPQKDRSVKPTSLGLLLGTLIGSGVVAFIAVILIPFGAGSYNEGLVVLGVVLMILSVAGLIFGAVLFCMYLYRAWKMIQDGYAYATPREAVGFLFIPFYSLYWYFQAFWRWSKDYNSFIQRHALNAPRMPEGLFLTFAIMCASFPILGMIPFLNIIFVLSVFVVQIIMIIKMCKAINFFASRSE